MAITSLNERTYYAGGITSVLVSVFMKPSLYFKVSGAGAVSAPTAEIDINGTSETVNIEAVYEKTDSTEHYFIVDLSEVAKYILRRYDGLEIPDDLEFINGNLFQIFPYSRAVSIVVYFERGTANEQTVTYTMRLSYNINRLPHIYGFNLIRDYFQACARDQKWSKDTYNALFTLTGNGSGQTGSYRIYVNGTQIFYQAANPAQYHQYKFDKTTNPLIKGRNEIKIDNTTAIKTFYIDYDPDDTCSKCLCWQHPQLGYVSYPFEGAMATQTDVSAGVEVGKLMTTMVNVGQLKEQMGYKKTKRVTLWTKAESKYWPLLEELYNSRHVYLFVGESGADDTAATWAECRVSGGYSDVSNRHSKVFSVELTLPEQYTISF